MVTPFMPSFEPSQDKKLLRKQLQAERQGLLDRHQRSVHLQEVLRVWLVGRRENSIGAIGRSRVSLMRCRRFFVGARLMSTAASACR